MPALALYERHRPLLDDALQALSRRGHWSPFPEAPSPKVYGETAQAQGHAAVQALFGKDYPLRQPGERARVATEQSPYGVALDIRYPECDAQALVDAAQAAEPAWRRAELMAGSRMLISSAMMPMTTRSSTSVNPR